MKYDYVKITIAKKQFYLDAATYHDTMYDHGDEDYDPKSYGISAAKVEKFKNRKSDTHTLATNKEIDELENILIKLGKPIAAKMKKEDAKREKAWKKRDKKERDNKLKEAKNIAREYKLPEGIRPDDLIYPTSKEHPTDAQKESSHINEINASAGWCSFNMYFVKDWGWCVPTLHIHKGLKGLAHRAYAVRISNGNTVRIGNGPHVLKTVNVYLKKRNYTRLKPILGLMNNGAVEANQIRDRISTRRMRRRSIFGY